MKPPTSPGSWSHAAGQRRAARLVCLALAACTSGPRASREDTGAVRQFAARGYASVEHAMLAGTAKAGSDNQPDAKPRASDGAASAPSGETAGAHQRGSRRKTGVGSGSGCDRSAAVDGGARSALSATQRQMRLTALQDVTTALLDAYVKADPMARDWLASDAARWLGSNGSLQRK